MIEWIELPSIVFYNYTDHFNCRIAQFMCMHFVVVHLKMHCEAINLRKLHRLQIYGANEIIVRQRARLEQSTQLWLAPVVAVNLLIGHQQTAISNLQHIVFVDIERQYNVHRPTPVWVVLCCVVFCLRSKCIWSNSKREFHVEIVAEKTLVLWREKEVIFYSLKWSWNILLNVVDESWDLSAYTQSEREQERDRKQIRRKKQTQKQETQRRQRVKKSEI